MQDPDPRFQLRVPCKSHDTSVDLAIDRRMWSSQQRSMFLSRHHTGLSVLRVTAAELPQRFRVEAICLGMAAVAVVADLDHPAHLDAQMRASRGHGEALRRADVRFSADRPVDGPQSEKRRSARSQGRSRCLQSEELSV